MTDGESCLGRGDLRLRHRRRRLGRLRAGRPAERGRPRTRAGARVRRRGPLDLHPDAGGAVDPDEHADATTGAIETEPEPHLGGRRLHTPRGKVLGGSSSINGLVYVRGNPLRFRRAGRRRARRAGAIADVLPYFRRAESAGRGRRRLSRRRRAAARRATARWPTRCTAPGSRPARQAGYPRTADINGFQQEGFGRMDMTVERRPALQRRATPICARRCSGPISTVQHARARDADRCSRAAAPSASRYRRGGRGTHGARAARGDPVAAGRSTRRSC